MVIPTSDCRAIFTGTFFIRARPRERFRRLVLPSCHGMHRAQCLVLGRSQITTPSSSSKKLSSFRPEGMIQRPRRYDSLSELPRRLLLGQFLAFFLLPGAQFPLVLNARLEAFYEFLECISILRTADAHGLHAPNSLHNTRDTQHTHIQQLITITTTTTMDLHQAVFQFTSKYGGTVESKI